jgi:hypothetical protein
VRCERSFPEAVLLYGDDGRICSVCETEAAEEEAHHKKLVSLVLSGPVLGFGGAVLAGLSAVPLVGLLTAVLTPFVGIVTLVQGGRAVLAAAREPDVTQGMKIGLLLSGGLSFAWGLNLVLMGTGLAIGHLVVLLTRF